MKVPSGEQMEPKISLGTLGKFILDEMHIRNMSMRKFADYVGVSHPTISRLVNGDDPPIPSLDFLAKLASATKIDPCALFELIFPDLAVDLDPDARILATQIGDLSDDAKNMLKTMVVATVLKKSQDAP